MDWLLKTFSSCDDFLFFLYDIIFLFNFDWHMVGVVARLICGSTGQPPPPYCLWHFLYWLTDMKDWLSLFCIIVCLCVRSLMSYPWTYLLGFFFLKGVYFCVFIWLEGWLFHTTKIMPQNSCHAKHVMKIMSPRSCHEIFISTCFFYEI